MYSSQEKACQLSSYLFYCFGYPSQAKVEDASASTILFLLLWVLRSWKSVGRLTYYKCFLVLLLLKSRERGWGFICYHTFPITFGIRFKRKWRTSQLSQFFCHFGGPSQEEAEDIWVISIFSVLWILKSRESGGRLSYYHNFPVTLGSSRCPWGFVVYQFGLQAFLTDSQKLGL